MRILFGKVLQLVTGGLFGCILGGILTGNENYWIALAIGFPLLLTVAGIFGARGARQQKAAGQPVLRPGIISTIPGMRPKPLDQAVLNPVSTAQPSAGVVLNGETVGASPAGAAAAPSAERLPLWWRALSILTMAAGAAIVLIPSYQMIGWVAQDAVAGRLFDGRDMLTGVHQQDAFDQLAGVIGSTEVVSINFYDSFILVSAPTSPGARTVDSYEWKAGIASRQGPASSQPEDLQGELFDAGDIDMSLVATLVRQSLDDARIEGVDGVYPVIRRPDENEAPVINIPISGTYFSAYYSYTVTGELIQRSGSAFD
jgi:hypothetical protein